jgi:Ca-activated chloride channel homolog
MGLAKNYYQILNLPRDASLDEIRRAYRIHVRENHPDAHPDDPNATENFINVQEAYEILSDTVRRERYDKTLVPEKSLIDIKSIYSRSAILNIKEPQIIFALLNLSPPENAADTPPPPLNVCILLDHSTSMKGARMDMVKSSAIEIIRQIRPQDILSIVSFGDHADVLLPAGSRRDLRQVEHNIQMMQAAGGTEIYSGLSTGFHEVKRNASSRHVNHILLLTDGRTYGDEDKCFALAQEAIRFGVGISGLGIGDEWNDQFLDRLTTVTGGDTTYIEKNADIKKFMEEKFHRLSKIYADNVVFQFTKDEQVKFNYAFRIQPEAAPLEENDGVIRLGNIPNNQPLKILFEIMVSSITQEMEEITLGEGRVTMDIPTIPQPQISKKIFLARQVTLGNTQEKTPQEIISALSQVTLYRMQEKTQKDLEAGNTDDAILRLQNLATHLLEQGATELARTVLIEAQNVSKTKMISAEGTKRIKYGTRGLMLEAGTKVG